MHQMRYRPIFGFYYSNLNQAHTHTRRRRRGWRRANLNSKVESVCCSVRCPLAVFFFMPKTKSLCASEPAWRAKNLFLCRACRSGNSQHNYYIAILSAEYAKNDIAHDLCRSLGRYHGSNVMVRKTPRPLARDLTRRTGPSVAV
jgi:hypothetical protein